MENISIRPVKKKDLNALAEIFDKTYAIDVFDVGERWTKESAYAMLEYYLKRSPDLCFLAEENDMVVGAFLVGVKPWWDGNHLVEGEIFVHPDHQKKGIGTELLKFVFTYALAKYNVVRWDACTFRGKYPLAWYKSIGFEEITEWVLISGDPKKVLKKLEK